MFNPFPGLLTYSFFAPTLLRVAAAFAMFYIAYTINNDRDGILATHFPFVGKGRLWMVRVTAAVTALVGISLLVGADTPLLFRSREQRVYFCLLFVCPSS